MRNRLAPSVAAEANDSKHTSYGRLRFFFVISKRALACVRLCARIATAAAVIVASLLDCSWSALLAAAAATAAAAAAAATTAATVVAAAACSERDYEGELTGRKNAR